MKIITYSSPFKLEAVRKNLLLTFAVFGLAFSWQIQAQTGDTCDDPIEITELPFNDSGNTSEYGNNYTGDDIPAEDPDSNHFDGSGSIYYLDGDEAVYAFTSNGNGTIDIETVNDEGWNSLYVFTGCPFNLTVAYHTTTSGTVREIIGLPVSNGETYYIVISNWDAGGQDYSIDITGDITIPVECEGTPSAGTPDEVEMSVCPTAEFDLSVVGASDGALGQDRIWQSSASGDNNWVDIDGATSSSYTVSNGIDESTDYRYKVICDNSNETDISDVITVTLNPANQCYCDDATSTSVEPITRVVFAGIDNSSTAAISSDGYENFTDVVAEVEGGGTYGFSGEGNTNGNYKAYFTVWIDWNQNGVFETAEMYEIDGFIENSDGTDGQQVTSDIVVPSSAVTGETRMRIRKRYSFHQTDPCGSYTYGQTEDYAVNVTSDDSTLCQDPSDLVVADITETSVNVSWTEGGSENEWEIVYGAPGFDPETEGITMITQDNPAAIIDLDAETEYDVHVRAICGAADYSAWVGPESFITEGEPEGSYCEGEGVAFSDYGGIEDFGTSDGVTNIDNQDVQNSTGYHDFTDMVISQAAGESFTFTAAIEDVSFGDAGVAVYIDYNNDFEFDFDLPELAFTTSTDGFVTTVTATITIPADTDPGNYRLRLTSDWMTSSPTACNPTSSIHDYTLTVTEGDVVVCEAPSDLAVTDITETTVNVSWTQEGTETEWEVVYGAPGFDPEVDGTTTATQDNPIAITVLDAGTEYDVYVRAICGAGDQSDFNGPLSFMTQETVCDMPSDLVVADITDTTADVSWTQVGTETEWEVVYGVPGFDPEVNGTTITTSDNPTTLMDLAPETEYEVYVIAICADGSSDPLGPEAFTTDILSVNTQVFENLSFYPNPVKSQLTLKAGKQIENVEIYNLLGQNVLSNMPNSMEAQLNTDHLQDGVYLMKVTIHNSTKTFKIIKK